MINKIGDFFNAEYGQRELTSKSNINKGKNIVISSQGIDNGCYGFFDFPTKYSQNIITVPRTGSIGESFVQEYNFSATDDLIILIPKKKFDIEFLYYVSSIIRLEKWRFNYGRKITPLRLLAIKLNLEKFNFNKIKNFRNELLKKIEKFENEANKI